MGYLEAKYGLTYLDAGVCGFDGACNLLGKYLHFAYLFVCKVEEVINLVLGDHQCVSLGQGVDVEECIELVVLCNLVAGYFACYYSAENSCQ